MFMSGNNSAPIVLAGTWPYQLIFRDDDNWQMTLDDVNHRDYDYIKLHRLSGTFDVGLDPIYLAIGFDGSLILPLFGELSNKKTYQRIFNTFLGKLLFGGVFFEAVTTADISLGEMTNEGYFRYIQTPNGFASRIHRLLQEVEVTSLEAIQLLNPPNITLSSIYNALDKGNNILSNFPNLSVAQLLSGITFLNKWEWAEALIFIWTSIEQIINKIWIEEIYNKRNEKGVITKRSKFLMDERTWTASTRIELFYQKGLIEVETYRLINKVRKARNDFIHDGIVPNQNNAINALQVLMRVMSKIITNYQKPNELENIEKLILKYMQRSLLPKKKRIHDDQIVAWRKIKPIPGEKNWGEKEFEKVEGFEFERVPIEVLKENENYKEEQ